MSVARVRLGRRSIGALALGAASAFGAAASCTIFNGLVADGPDAAESSAADADPDSGRDGSACVRALAPDPQLGMPDGEGPAFIVAARRIQFVAGQSSLPAGFDLDGVCTCAPGPESCVRPQVPPPGDTPACDGDGGRDNALGDLAGAFEESIHFERGVNDLIQAGSTLLMRVEGYNGQPNDANVTVRVFTTLGAFRDAGSGDPEKVPPRFSTEDQWGIDDGAKEQSGVGYVVAGQLVVKRMATLTVGPGLSLTFREGVISGRIVPLGNGTFTLEDVVVAGRWPADEALGSLGALKDSARVPLCTADDGGTALEQATYRLLKETVCSHVDIATLQDLDNTGAPCNALSGGALITTAAAQMDASFHMIGDASTTACSDRCPK